MSGADFFKAAVKKDDRGPKQLTDNYGEELKESYLNQSIRKFTVHLLHKRYVKFIQIMEILSKRMGKPNYADIIETIIFELAEKEGITDEFLKKEFEGKMIKFENLEEESDEVSYEDFQKQLDKESKKEEN